MTCYIERSLAKNKLNNKCKYASVLDHPINPVETGGMTQARSRKHTPHRNMNLIMLFVRPFQARYTRVKYFHAQINPTTISLLGVHYMHSIHNFHKLATSNKPP
jgi:hypothetical protein